MVMQAPHDSFREFAHLARLGARESLPPVDVRADVLRQIRIMRESIERPLVFMAVAATVTATVLAVLVYPQLQTMLDPLTSLVAEASESLR
jgi:hypothetical protein